MVDGYSPFWFSTLSEDYVVLESNPLAAPDVSATLIDMSTLSAAELSTRWGRLLNTYFITSCVPTAATGAYAPYSYGQFTSLASDEVPFQAVQTTAQVTTSQRIYRPHTPYLILTLVSALVLWVRAGPRFEGPADHGRRCQ